MKKRQILAYFAGMAMMCLSAGEAFAYSICIDAGHGGTDPGAMGCGLQEADVTLNVAKKLETLLKSAGYTVYMTRTDNSTVSLSQRSSYANSKGVDTFASIHNNSATVVATGIETYCYLNNLGKKSGTQAKNIQEQMLAVWPLANRGAKEADFHVVRETSMPATLSELAFINNCDKDAQYLGSDAHRLEAAQAHCKAIVKQWGGNASACSGGGTPAPQTGNVCGYVTDGASAGAGNKLDGASYTCGGKTVTSSSTTVSKFELPVGGYTCSASKSGYDTNTRKDCAAVTAGSGCTAWCSVNIQATQVVPVNGTAKGSVTDSVSKLKVAATVSVAGGSSASYDGSSDWSFSLPAGTYTIKATANGYDDNSVSCKVTSDVTTSCPITLNPKKATIHGNILDKDSSAKIAGHVALGTATASYDGQSEWSFTIDAGTYTVTATADGYNPGSTKCTAGKGESISCDVSLTKATQPDMSPGMLRGTITDGESGDLIAGTVTLENGDVSYYNGSGSWQFYLIPGSYKVTGNADGYEESVETCDVTAGKETNCPLKLNARSVHTTGYVYDAVSKDHIGAEVKVTDSKGAVVQVAKYENTTAWEADLRPGTYTVTATAEGYTTKVASCSVAAGESASCNVALVREGTELGRIVGVVHDSRSELYLIAAHVQVEGGDSITFNPYAQECQDDSCKMWTQEDLSVGTYTVTASAPGYFSNTVTCEALTEEAGISVCKIPLTSKSDADNYENIETGVEPTITYFSDDSSCSASPRREHGFGAFAALLAALSASVVIRRRRAHKGE